MTRSIFTAGIFFLVFASLAFKTFGQISAGGGARAIAMAETGLLLEDEYGLFNNPGATVADQLALLLSYHSRYLTVGINDAQVGLLIPAGTFSTGVSIRYYGDHLYNQLEINTMANHQVGFARIGLRLGYRQFYLENYGYKRTPTVALGGIFTLSEQVKMAMLISNLTRSKLSGQEAYRLSSLLVLGLSYQPVSAFRVDVQISKDVNLPVSGSLGMEYRVNQYVSARTGFDFTKALAALGFGFHWKKFSLDLAGNYQPRLGFSTALSFLITRKNAD